MRVDHQRVSNTYAYSLHSTLEFVGQAGGTRPPVSEDGDDVSVPAILACEGFYRYLQPLIDELVEFYSGIWLQLDPPSKQATLVQCVLGLVNCDVPATRYVCFRDSRPRPRCHSFDDVCYSQGLSGLCVSFREKTFLFQMRLHAN